MRQPTVLIDSAIPYIKGILEPYARVRYLPGADIAARDVRDVDALVVRTRTRCDGELLAGSAVKLVATATIGYDHIDTEWCAGQGIEVRTAAGCNARGVLQWVAAALAWLSLREGWHPEERTLGIVGVGHVGSLVDAYARAWGFRTVCCDPPREEREQLGFVSVEEVARRSDIVTFHTPLDATTRHLCDERLLETMRPAATVLNASRGGVVDGQALLRSGHPAVLDVWEHEPRIDSALLERALLATPHIAGYSEQGKATATAMAVEAVARRFSLPLAGWYPPQAAPSSPRPIGWEELCRTIGGAFDIEALSRRLKSDAGAFEPLRDNYLYRKEYF